MRKGPWHSRVAAAVDRIREAWRSGSKEEQDYNNCHGDSHGEAQEQLGLPIQTAQKRLRISCPYGYKSCSATTPGGQPNNDQACGVNECYAVATARASAVLIAHPKITQGPKINRKLGSNKWDLVHDGIQAEKREATSCPSDYQLCPQSLNGGCCPTDRVCGTSSCYPTSAAAASACGMSGYVACGIAEGGGCCPASYSCAAGGCSPLPGVAFSETCGFDSYLCPSSLNYGCCKTGLACGLKNCYATSITTVTLIETFTTTDDSSHTLTLTSTLITAETPASPSAAASSTSILGVVPKIGLQPTAIPKTAASSPPATGLTTAEIGGIIGGAVAILITIILATFFILRRLNKAIKISNASKSRTTSSRTRSGRPNLRPSIGQDVDLLSIDPLIMTGSSISPSIHHPSHPSALHSPVHEVEGTSPPQFASPYSPRSPSTTYNPTGYRPVAPSESHYSSSSYGHRNPSLDSTPPIPNFSPPTSYFDIPRQPPQPPMDLRDQNLRFGHDSPPAMHENEQRPVQHVRNWSDASDISQLSAGSSNLIELDAGTDGDRRGSLQRALRGLGMGRMISRRRSEPGVLTGGPVRAAAVGGSPGEGAGVGGLGYISERGESRGG